MPTDINSLRLGLVLAMLTLIFGIGMGVVFGTNEDGVKDFIAEGIAAHPALHDENSQSKIWRYAQRAHFHATGVSAFSLVLILIAGLARLSPRLKFVSATLIGIGSFYPLSWFSMFLLSPGMGRDAAHHALSTELITLVSVASLALGILLVLAGILYDFRTRGEGRVADARPA